LEWLWRTLTYGRRPPFRIGESSADVKPLRWIEGLQQWWKGANPRRILVMAWIGMAIWAALLILWSVHLRGGIRTITLPGSDPEEAEIIPGQEGVDGDDQAQVPETEYLVIDPSAYDPGPIAASGDLLALTESFDVEAALTQIEALVGPAHLGRLAGSPEGRAAAEYIAERFAEYGLQPAGDDGTYFQEFPVPYSILADIPTLTAFKAGGRNVDRRIRGLSGLHTTCARLRGAGRR
jgi:hypothetical protein